MAFRDVDPVCIQGHVVETCGHLLGVRRDERPLHSLSPRANWPPMPYAAEATRSVWSVFFSE